MAYCQESEPYPAQSNERAVVRPIETGADVNPRVVPYLNRLSDLLGRLGRLHELRAGLDTRLRDDEHKGPRWSHAC